MYRTRDNRNFCKTHGIRLSGPKLGRPSLAMQSAKEKKQEYQDNTDRIEVERSFSLSKRCYGMDLIRTSIIHVNWRYVSRRISFHSARRRNEAYRWLRRLTTMLQMGI
ncbi:transposase [Eubacterium ventriosum]|uniref:transposase n=1 Tax=Eubacterium ventriosum TaxID=39496 RepID=UPI003F4D1C35